jgi:hypothetical protein
MRREVQMNKIKFASACMKFFGKKPGETLLQFANEVKALTPEDKAELAPMLSEALGVEVETE